jgi:hypothetical protein
MKIGEGTYAINFNLGDAKVAVANIRDIGRTVAKIFAEKKFLNEYYGLASDKISM